jgi:hypothetical protein
VTTSRILSCIGFDDDGRFGFGPVIFMVGTVTVWWIGRMLPE